MNNRTKALLAAFWLNAAIAPVAFATDGEAICFYLDTDRFGGPLMPVHLTSDSAAPIELRHLGLFQGHDRLCQWSRNGGSGVREHFALDGEFAVPILDPPCEAPFSHVNTGVGFGDWYLTLCGTRSGDDVVVPFSDAEYSIDIESLQQWTQYRPADFPIEGDSGI